jgi:hemolysin III
MHAAIEHPRYTLAEELAHSITHGVGGLLSLVALGALLSVAEGALAITACGVFGATLVLTYAASTLYHAVPQRFARAKAILRKLDHCCIFLLIAGTYTPVLLLTDTSNRGFGLLVTVWALAASGVVLELMQRSARRLISILLYLGMGWLVVAAGRPLLASMTDDSLTWLMVGGATYSIGVVFYVWRRLPYGHAIWHGFVLAGSASHFFCVMTLLH